MNACDFRVPPTALRIFAGYRRKDLSLEEFRKTVGASFMPGTPYMLQPLGLAAYLPGVVMQEPTSPASLPDEFAIIAYPSREKWHAIMTDTLRGRVYNQSHAGVYDSALSGASFPVHIDNLPEQAVDPYFIYDVATDWQSGRTAVFVGTGPDARSVTRRSMRDMSQRMRDSGVDQCIVASGDNWSIVWLHSLTADPRAGLAQGTISGLETLLFAENRRIVCVGEPPAVALQNNDALNFVFLRAAEHFLE